MRRLSIASPLVLAAILATVVLVDRVGVFPGFVQANELSRLQGATAMALSGTPAVDEWVERLGSHQDLSRHDGKLYSNKAPGLILLWVPVVKLLSWPLGPPAPATLWAFLYAARLLTVSLPWILALVPLARLVRRFGGDDETAAALHLALTFASPLGIYAGLGFSHVPGAVLLLVAAERLFDVGADDEPSPGRWRAAAAAIAGAASMEYPLAIPGAVLLAGAWLRRPRLRPVVESAVTGAVVLLPFFAYNAVAFGGPFQLSTAHEAFAPHAALAAGGLFGVRLPTLPSALRLLFSPAQGLFAIVPWIAVATAGLALPLADRRRRPLAATVLAAAAALVVVIAGYPNWHLAWGTGCRYLVPVLPLLALGLVPLAADRRMGPATDLLFPAGVGAALVVVTLAANTFPHTPYEIPFPPSWHLDLLLGRQVAPNLGFLPVPVVGLAAAVAAAAGIVRSREPVARRSVALVAGGAIAIAAALAGPRP